MNPRERVLTALGRAEPDRVPVFYRDVPEVGARLIRELGLRDREDLLRFFEVDFRWIGPDYVGPPLEDAQSGVKRDIWGVPHKYMSFSETAGYWEVESHPLENCGDTATISFDHVGSGLKTDDNAPPRHFEIAGDSGAFHSAQAKIDGDKVIARSPFVPQPRSVRYAWMPFPEPPVNLVNSVGLPASPFSTTCDRDKPRKLTERDEL